MRENTRMVLGLAMVGAVTILVAVAARGDGFWAKKDWKQWTEEDTKKLLENSPWARPYNIGRSVVSAALPSRSGAAQRGAAGEDVEEIYYYVQLRSALPVREALVRQEQLKHKYDKMMPDEKQKFDAENEELLGHDYDKEILVHVVYGSNIRDYEMSLATYWQGIPEGTLPLNVFLITPRGDHVGPVRYVSPKNGEHEFELVFPRSFNGEPTIREGDKWFRFEFPHPQIADLPQERGLVDFHTDQMMYNGRLAY